LEKKKARGSLQNELLIKIFEIKKKQGMNHLTKKYGRTSSDGITKTNTKREKDE